jgi:hypothetical protein
LREPVVDNSEGGIELLTIYVNAELLEPVVLPTIAYLRGE